MIFNEAAYYFAFLIPSVFAFHASSRRVQPWIIVAGGIAFFCYFGSLHFGGLIGALTVLILIWELLTSRLYSVRSKWCLFGLVQAIMVLGYFKYSKFFNGVWNDFAGAPSIFESKGWLSPVLPLGISFFTFEFIHFAVDRYKGKIARNSLSDYAAFIFFFPTMVAGPIKRFQDFAPELNNARLDGGLFARGITRILAGLVKKVCIADTFGLASSNLNTEALYAADGFTVAMWLCAYGMKIYFDFSAYSDIAIGSAALFGIKVPENFNWPYFSQNISEFWRRWHISLGRWIYDYVYAPQKGLATGVFRISLSLLIAFFISGLWHGAAYNFIAWGMWHGIFVVLHRLWAQVFTPKGIVLPKVINVALTFTVVNLGWAFFCMDLRRASYAIQKILGVA